MPQIVTILLWLKEAKRLPRYEYYHDTRFSEVGSPVFLRWSDIEPGHTPDPHWHENVETLYCVRGAVEANINGLPYVFSEGQICVIESNAVHFFRTSVPGSEYYYFFLDRMLLKPLGVDVETVRFAPLVTDDALAREYEALVKADERKPPYYKLEGLSRALALYAGLLQSDQLIGDEPKVMGTRDTPGIIRSAIRYIQQHFSEKLSVECVCGEENLSKYYFCRLFKSYTGMSFVRYVNALRCEQAHKLLVSGECNVTEAALRCGVDNVSYFSQLYARYQGVAPSQIRKPAAEK